MNQHDRAQLSLTLTAELSYWLAVANGEKPNKSTHIKAVLKRLEQAPEATKQVKHRLREMRVSSEFEQQWQVNLDIHLSLLESLKNSNGFSDEFRLRMAFASLRKRKATARLWIDEGSAQSFKGFVVLVADEERQRLDSNKNIIEGEYLAVSIFGTPAQMKMAKTSLAKKGFELHTPNTRDKHVLKHCVLLSSANSNPNLKGVL